MLNRRGKPFGPTVLFIFLLLFAGYGFYLYNEQYSKFIESEGKLALTKKRQLSLKSQLHVVYEHRTKLEAALIKEKKNHRITRKEYISKMKECQANLTKAKYEAMNRFNALDTEHKMLKAKHEEINTDYSNLQQQYVRLSEDHQKIVTGQKEDFERLKETKDKESRSLQERVKTLYNEKEEQKAESSKYFGYYKSERNERVKLTNSITELNNKISDLEDKAYSFESERDELKGKLAGAEKEIAELEKTIKDLEHQAKQRSAITHHEIAKFSPAQPSIPPTVIAKLQSKVVASQSSSKPHVDPVRREESPSKRMLQATTTILNRENVKSKILGIGRQHLGKNLKPSDKVQQLLIGKKTDTRQEDSLIDEYNTVDLNRLDKHEGTEARYVGRPTIKTKGHVKETRFRDLVIKPTSGGNSVGNKRKLATEGLPIVDGVSEISATEKQVKGDNSDAKKVKESIKKVDDASPSKEQVSQYSKVRADAAERKSEQVDDSEKEADAGEAFLKKQQQLMHRGAEREDDSKVVESQAESDERVAGDKKSKKANDALDVHKDVVSKNKFGGVRVPVKNDNNMAVHGKLPAKVSDNEKDGWEMVKERESEMKQSKGGEEEEKKRAKKGKKNRVESVQDPRKIEERRQLPAPDAKSRKKHVNVDVVNKETQITKETKLTDTEREKDTQNHLMKHRNQLHAPIKKPKEMIPPKEKNPNEDTKEEDGNLEDEVSDRDVDKSKKNGKDESDKVDTEDESRTGFK